MGSMETTNHAKIAVDLFVLDELLNEGQRIASFLKDPCGTLNAMTARKFGMTGLDAGGNLPPITRTASPSSVLGINNDRVTTATRNLESCMQAGITRTDDNNISSGWQIS